MRTIVTPAFLFILLLKSALSVSQTIEIGGIYGYSGYIGDLNQSIIEVTEVHPSYGIHSRINWSQFLSTRLCLSYGAISGSDSEFSTLEDIRSRNLSFKSPLYEASLQVELNYLRFGNNEDPLAQASLFTGIAGFYFNPMAEYQGKQYALQPLGTEGQFLTTNNLKPYNLVQLAIPIGIGFSIRPANRVVIGFEFGLRKTFTDYLDDVSTVYPDISALKVKNPMAATLSYRTPEIGGEKNLNPVGQKRGENGKDAYFQTGISLSIQVSK
jgi:hypothetical protein